ncbi:hypothetical protein [Proteiniphilum sp. UBA5463]|jgi:hypothetical protein|uniref:hypothetical protein n=1 Tax=Proteiniphilum sp. UBA5463 TaxID=1947281 RepID=UPI00257D5CC8|nr:hypothetical protein [Proteiniphilum sp. UBA5463]
MEFDFNIEINDFDLDIPMMDNGFKNRYKKSKIARDLPAHKIKYSNAQKLARDIKLDTGIRYDAIVAGNFIFGDFIEAFITHNNAKCTEMTISTLSLDQNNVDSLVNLMEGKFVDNLNMIVSDYFFAHERKSLIPYIYDKLDIDDRFQLASAGSHTKIVLFETAGKKKIVIHGSANLRSSSNIEQFTIEENPGLYDFHLCYHKEIIEKYKTINKEFKRNKSLRGKQLWDLIKKL